MLWKHAMVQKIMGYQSIAHFIIKLYTSDIIQYTNLLYCINNGY